MLEIQEGVLIPMIAAGAVGTSVHYDYGYLGFSVRNLPSKEIMCLLEESAYFKVTFLRKSPFLSLALAYWMLFRTPNVNMPLKLVTLGLQLLPGL
jgi:hypothetical protein